MTRPGLQVDGVGFCSSASQLRCQSRRWAFFNLKFNFKLKPASEVSVPLAASEAGTESGCHWQ